MVIAHNTFLYVLHRLEIVATNNKFALYNVWYCEMHIQIKCVRDREDVYLTKAQIGQNIIVNSGG